MQEGIRAAFEKLLADRAVLEKAILGSTAAYREGGYILHTGTNCAFSKSWKRMVSRESSVARWVV